MLVLCLYMKITTCLLVLINQSRTESYEFVSSLSAHDSSQREIQKTGISYMITMGWTHLLILSCVTQLPSIWCSCLLFWIELDLEECPILFLNFITINLNFNSVKNTVILTTSLPRNQNSPVIIKIVRTFLLIL